MSAPAIRLLRIDHVVLRVRDLERSLAFYRDVLGCPLELARDELGLYQLRAGDALIDLVTLDGPLGGAFPDAPARDAPNVDHVCVQVADWDEAAIRAWLAEQGVEAGETGRRYGAQGFGPSIYVRDPDGNTVELKGPPEAG